MKGVKQLGRRSGNWLNIEQARMLLDGAAGETLRSKRDLAMISVLLGCGLRRAELASLKIDDIQLRQGHWAIVDLVGKGGHVRTVPMPFWVKNAVGRWIAAAGLTGADFSERSAGTARPGVEAFRRMSSGTSFAIVPGALGLSILHHTIFVEPAPNYAIQMAVNLSRSSSSWVTPLF